MRSRDVQRRTRIRDGAWASARSVYLPYRWADEGGFHRQVRWATLSPDTHLVDEGRAGAENDGDGVDDGEVEVSGVNRVVLVAAVGEGTTPAASSGQTAAPTYASITTTVYADPFAQEETSDFSLHLFFEEGLTVLREQWWGSRASVEEVLGGAELCGVPRDRWRHTHQDWPHEELPEALQPSSGPRLRAQRSYDFAVWPKEWSSGRSAAEAYRRRSTADTGPRRDPDAALVRLVERLLSAHPYTTEPDYSHNPWDDHPFRWADGDYADLRVKFWAVPAMCVTLAQAADSCGFEAYDPQTRAALPPAQS